jgi:membrane protein DedA with SNARE-associated domain
MEHFLATWGYAALFAITLVSALGIPIGSEVAIGYSGALASGQLTTAHDHMSLGLVIFMATLGEIVGSTAGYCVGRYGGRPLVDALGKYVLLTHRDLDRAEAWFARRGEWFVLFGRFIPLLRSFVSLAAGLGEMAFAKFLVFTVIGCAMWCAALASIGYSLGASWHAVIHDFSYAGYALAALAVVAIVALVIHRITVVREERAAHSALGRQVRARTNSGEADDR